MTGLGANPVPKTATPEEERIQRGVLRYVREAITHGTPLLGELELATRLDASRQQIRHALSRLHQQGIVHRRQGAATLVDPVGLRMSVRLEEQFDHEELLSRMGYTPRVEVLASEREPLGGAIAGLLSAESGIEAMRVRKRWLADERPAMIATDIIPLPRGAEIDAAESVFSAMAPVWGEPVVWEVATPGAAALDERLAALFDLPVGTPVMTLELIGVGASGRRLFWSFEHHHPDIVRYSLVRTVRPPWVTH